MSTKGRKKSTSTLLERLLAKVIIDEVTDCWEYQGGKNNVGYGMIRDEKKMRTTHRVSYEEHNQTTIPHGLCVMHKCDNPACVNPAHLSVGTRKDNSEDMMRKGRCGTVGRSWRKGIKVPRLTCTHCGRDCASNLFTRYHGDNCKMHPDNV